ncbi:hypothetical protein [Beduini sp.]|uniref:hypothetical protein n=1 Tax=Beduini sp. TaxID=1922300 RepID=UPI0039A212DA
MKYNGKIGLTKSSLKNVNYHIDYSNGVDYTAIATYKLKDNGVIQVENVKIIKKEVKEDV